ncbi:MAG: spore germination protein GerW family protein [Gemmatimonadota bacterium]
MASSLEGLVERVMGELHRIVQTRTVVGEPVQAGRVTLIPVSKISFGFGAGSGQEGKGQSGTGGGASIEPIGFVAVDEEGKVQILTLREKEAGWGQLVELMPDAIARVRSFLSRSKRDPVEDEQREEQDAEDGGALGT